MGLREHINGNSLPEPVPAGDKDAQVTGEGARGAGDVGDFSWGKVGEEVEDCGVAAGARRVQDYDVGSGVQGGEDVFGLALNDADVGEGPAVDNGVFNGGGGLLKGDYLSVVRGEQDGEGPDSTVGVSQEFIAGGLEAIT